MQIKAIVLTVILIPLCACSWFGSGAKRDPYIDARETCVKEVKRQGKELYNVDELHFMSGTTYEVKMRAKDSPKPVQVVCIYDAATDKAELQ